jgi:hypothetical protein
MGPSASGGGAYLLPSMTCKSSSMKEEISIMAQVNNDVSCCRRRRIEE